jgi:hypothetical protein
VETNERWNDIAAVWQRWRQLERMWVCRQTTQKRQSSHVFDKCGPHARLRVAMTASVWYFGIEFGKASGGKPLIGVINIDYSAAEISSQTVFACSYSLIELKS